MSGRYQQVSPSHEEGLSLHSMRDLEIVSDAGHGGSGSEASSPARSLSALAPPLLDDADGPNGASVQAGLSSGVSVPIWRRSKWLRCGCEVAILVVALIVAFLVGRESCSSGEPSASSTPTPASSRTPPVIVVSFDGFRWDYINLAGAAATPNFRAVRSSRHAVAARRLVPSFPSLTFPNHYTLVTGRVPESHGITANHIFDAATGRSFSYTDKASQTSEWWRAQTAWGLAEQFNVTTGTVMWVGSETPIEGRQPSVWLPYNEAMPNTARVDQLFEWVDSGACTLCFVYFSDVDSAGHAYGAASPEVLQQVAKMDALVGDIEARLAARGLDQTASLVLLADHGMATVTDFIYLDDYLDLSSARGLTHQETGAFVNIWLPLPIDAQLQEEVARNLTGVPHLTCWKKDDTPDYLHYQASTRIAPVNCVCDVGYVTSARAPGSSWRFGGNRGVHGYMPSADEMGALFIARSPKFDSGADGRSGTIESLANVNVFNLLASLLAISPSPNNGTLVDFAPFLVR